MKSLPERITKKIDNSYVVWFEETNCWIQFQEPAFFIYTLFSQGIKADEISRKCTRKYGLAETESIKFVLEIIDGILKYSSITNAVPENPSDDIKLPREFAFIPKAVHLYLIKSKKISISYETQLTGYYIHPLIEHLELNNHGKPDFSFEIFTYKKFHVLRIKEQPKNCWFFEEFNQLKRRLFIEISNVIYKREESDWMSFIHASAVTDKKQTILFSSESGSGKSTFAGLLLDKGLQLVSDDFVILDSRSKKVYPFPAALSIKKGSYHLFSTSQLKPLSYQELRNTTTSYLDPHIYGKSWYRAYPANKLIFIRYNPDVVLEFNEIPVFEALILFHDQAKVSTHFENARKFINWFAGITCFNLEYSENPKAIETILGLLNKN